MSGRHAYAAAIIAALLAVALVGCGDLSDSPTDPSVTPGCSDCASRVDAPIIPTPVPVPTLDPALVAWRNGVHDRVNGLMKDLDAIGGCGGQNGDDRADCRQKIDALMSDARAMRSAVTAPPLPPDATDDAGKTADALDQLMQGCIQDDAALASTQMFVWLPGSMTSEAFQKLITIDDGLRTA